MAFNSSETQQIFPFSYTLVFDGLIATLPAAGYSIKSQDRVVGRIVASAPISGFSWGEDIFLQVRKRDDASTDVAVQSNLKVGLNWTATAKNAKNAERIISTLSNYLQSPTKDARRSADAAPTASSSPILYLLIGVSVLIMLIAFMSN